MSSNVSPVSIRKTLKDFDALTSKQPLVDSSSNAAVHPDVFQVWQANTNASFVSTNPRLLTLYEDYQAFRYKHIRESFEFQLFETKVIFWVVIALVVSGLVFAGLQFYIGTIAAKPTKKKNTNEEAAAVTDLEASLKGIKVKSSTLGVVLLVISMAFFYLYLNSVYKIE